MTTTTARALVARLAELLRHEHEAMAEFLIHLAEFDRLRGWRELGYAGLFPFLERELGLSKSGAFFRMKAAQLIQEYPKIVEPTADAPRPLAVETSSQTVLPGEPTDSTCSSPEALAPAAPPRDEIVPLTGDRSRVHLSVSRAFVEKLETAKMALSHIAPGPPWSRCPRPGWTSSSQRPLGRRPSSRSPGADRDGSRAAESC